MEEKVVILGSNWNEEDGAIKPLVNGYAIFGNRNPILFDTYKSLSEVIKIHPLEELNGGIKSLDNDITFAFTGNTKEEILEMIQSLSDEEIDDLFEQQLMFRSFAQCVFENVKELCERGEEGRAILKKFVLKLLSPECTTTDKGILYFNEIEAALSVVLINSTYSEEPVFDKNLLVNFFSDNNDNLDRGYGSNIDISKILVENRPKYDMRTMLAYIHRGYHKDGSMNLDYIVNDIIENIEEYKKSMESSKNILSLSIFDEPVSPVMLIKLYEIVKMFDGKIKLGLVVLEKSAIETEDSEKVLNIIAEIINNIGELAAVYYISLFAKPLIDFIKFDPMIIAKAVFQKPYNAELLNEVLGNLILINETRYYTLRSLLTLYKSEGERKNIIKIVKGLIDLNNPKLCLDIMLYFMHEFSLTDATAITLELLVGAGKEVNKRSGAELIASLMSHPGVTTIEQSKTIYNTLIGLHR